MKKYTKGFTLIELLVVIAIIGILSSVVLVSLNSARDKGRVAKFQAEMSGLRTALEAGYSGNAYNAALLTGVPGDITTGTGDATQYVESLAGAAPGGVIYATISNNAYAVYGRLPGKDAATVAVGEIWCFDSLGKSGLNDAEYVAADFVDATTLTSCTHNNTI
jgi:prepilin-type N-terminal cleavage/methylation domain-containing protein